MNYTDEELKKTIAKMLPDVISYREVTAYESGKIVCLLQWGAEWDDEDGCAVRETELLHLCWLVEKTLNETEFADYAEFLHFCWLVEKTLYAEFLRPITVNYKLLYEASWQQRVVALAKAKGIKI